MIPESEQRATDFDWLGLDASNHVGHFTTAGFKCLPRSVADSAEDLKTVTAYFKQLVPTGAGYRVRRELETEVGEFSSESDRSRYLHSFAEMADRGLFTFDIDTYEREGLAYFLVAEPIEPIVVDALPSEIRNILERTQLRDFRFGKDVHIPYQVTLGR